MRLERKGSTSLVGIRMWASKKDERGNLFSQVSSPRVWSDLERLLQNWKVSSCIQSTKADAPREAEVENNKRRRFCQIQIHSNHPKFFLWLKRPPSKERLVICLQQKRQARNLEKRRLWKASRGRARPNLLANLSPCEQVSGQRSEFFFILPSFLPLCGFQTFDRHGRLEPFPFLLNLLSNTQHPFCNSQSSSSSLQKVLSSFTYSVCMQIFLWAISAREERKGA